MKQEPFEPGRYYHVFNRGNNKENIFFEPANYDYFIQLMKKYFQDSYTIFAYCLLPNHFHFLLKINDNKNLPNTNQEGSKRIHQPFSNMFNAYSKAINKKYKRTGSLFQKHLHRIKIESEEYFRSLVIYIHLNPDKHNIVTNYKTYPYSSYKAYVNDGSSMIKRNEVLNYFGDKKTLIYCHEKRKINIDILNNIEEIDS